MGVQAIINHLRRPTMLRKTILAAVLASFAVAGSAAGAQAPLLGPVTIIKAGQKTPIDVAGNHLHRGATIRKGTELRRWLVTMPTTKTKATIKLYCGPGATHVGLGIQEEAKLNFAVASTYYHRTIKVVAHGRAGARASIYALCKTS
jgi:hypothetical protein